MCLEARWTGRERRRARNLSHHRGRANGTGTKGGFGIRPLDGITDTSAGDPPRPFPLDEPSPFRTESLKRARLGFEDLSDHRHRACDVAMPNLPAKVGLIHHL